MLHGDLHTGSVMLTPDETRIIDPEFAFMGPMGFDIGAVIANFLINYFSHDGHEESPGGRDSYRDWVLVTVEAIWTLFRSKFLDLWRANGTGDAYPASLFLDAAGRCCARGRTPSVHGPALARHHRICGRQDDPPGSGACAQHRP